MEGRSNHQKRMRVTENGNCPYLSYLSDTMTHVICSYRMTSLFVVALLALFMSPGCMSRPNVETLTIQRVTTSGFRGKDGNTQFRGIRHFDYAGNFDQIRHIGLELSDGSVVSIADVDIEWLQNAVQRGLAKHRLPPLAPKDSGLSEYTVNQNAYTFGVRDDAIVGFTSAPLPWGMASGDGVLWDLRDNTRYEMPLSREEVHRLFGEPDNVEFSSFHMK